MTLLDDRLIGTNGLQIARFFDASAPTESGDGDDALPFDDDGLDMAFSVWN